MRWLAATVERRSASLSSMVLERETRERAREHGGGVGFCESL